MAARHVCPNCEAPRRGRFCTQCGQDNGIERLSTREFLKNQGQNFLSWESRFGSTLKGVVFNPGVVAREYAEGKRARYVHPARFAFLALAIWFLAMQSLGIDPLATSPVKFNGPNSAASATLQPGASSGEEDPRPSIPAATDGEASGGVDETIEPGEEGEQRVEELRDFVRKYLNLFLYLALPALAVALRFLFKDSGRNLAEVMVFVLYLEGLQFLLAALVTPLPLLFPVEHQGLAHGGARTLRALLVFAWFAASARAFFGTNLWGSTWRYVLARALQILAMIVLLLGALACWLVVKLVF